MDVLALPKKLGSLQYRVLVLPYRLARPTFLADESALRLSYDRALGSLDRMAGRLLGDPELVQRGTALTKRADALATAVELEDRAAQHAEVAQESREQGLDDVQRRRRQAAQEAASSVSGAREAERAEKARVERETEQREQAEKARIEAQVERKAHAATSALQADQARIDAAEQAVSAAPKAQVQQAVDLQHAAEEDKRQAAALADLAEAERASRR